MTTTPTPTTPTSTAPPTMAVAFAAQLVRWWWLIAAQALAAVVVLVLVLASTSGATYDFTAHFVLHPDPSSPPAEVANRVSVLTQTGPLVQTVLKVLGSDEILRRAGTAAGVPDTSKYSISATVSPGSSFFDAGVSGANRATTEALGRSVEKTASNYVAQGYRGFKLDVLGSDEAKHDGFPPSPSLLVLVLLLGAVAAVGELFVAFGLARVRAIVGPALWEPATTHAPVEASPVVVEPVVVEPVVVEPVAATQMSDRPPARANGARNGGGPNGGSSNGGSSNGKRAKRAPTPGATSKAVRRSSAQAATGTTEAGTTPTGTTAPEPGS